MYRSQQHIDDASLQADVMRFMAIVAFCLVAIMAMVRNVEAPPVATETSAPPVEAATAPPAPAEPAPVPAPVPATRKAPPPQVVTVTRPPPPGPLEISQQPAPLPAQATATAVVVQPPVVPPVPEPEAVEPVAAEAPSEAAGLTLRFASDADFLRLVAKGRVTVYAFNEATVLRLNDAYQFEAAPAPGDVYELDAGTIPAHMRRTLPPDAANAPLTWAVGLSTRVRRQLNQHLAAVDSGSLLINRYEEVRHVAAD